MRSWIKWTGAAALGLMASTASAADHRDGPAATAEEAADIADVYAWSVENNTKLALIQTIVGDFSPAVQYVLHVGRSDNLVATLTMAPASWTNIICEFASATEVQCWVDDNSGTPVDYATGDPTSDMGITGVNGAIRLHAAEHGDPFFFYLDGFKHAREVVLGVDPSLLNPTPEGCPTTLFSAANILPATMDMCPVTETIAGLLRGLLNGDYADVMCTAGTPINNFETGNVHAIVAEIDKMSIAGTGELFAVYATTHTKP